jgi:phosphoesterase RecJ-like protein
LKPIGYPGAEVLKAAGSILITAHIHPDGDAAGSAIGLCLALRDMNRDAIILLAQPLPPSYHFLPGSGLVMHAASSAPCPPEMTGEFLPSPIEATLEKMLPETTNLQPAHLQGKRFDYGIVLDCTSLDRAGKEMAGILESCEFLINIDHHISNTGFGAINIVDPDASATGEILYRIMDGLGIKISPDTATNLYAAIVTDTGSFQYQNATSRCHQAASMLLDLGADHRNVQQCLNEHKKLSSIRLLEKGLSTLTLEQEGQIAWMSLPLRFFKETGCCPEDSEDFVNYPKSIAGVEVGILFKEVEDGVIRVGLRSKNIADVNALAGRFGGGGHERAAGCTIRGTLQEAETLLVDAARDCLQSQESEIRNHVPQIL